MEKLNRYLQDTIHQLQKSLVHLEYSYNKILKLTSEVDSMDEEILETWESFASRFARASDIFLMRFIKAKVRLDDPGFNGTFRDYLNQAEKIGLIQDVMIWMKIRELRNISAHEYSESNLEFIFNSLKELAPEILKVKNLI